MGCRRGSLVGRRGGDLVERGSGLCCAMVCYAVLCYGGGLCTGFRRAAGISPALNVGGWVKVWRVMTCCVVLGCMGDGGVMYGL